MGRFEKQYPLEARSEEIKQILQYATRGQSCELISVPGAGRSTVLRLLAYNEKIRKYHLDAIYSSSEAQAKLRSDSSRQARTIDYLFIYLNFAELPSFETNELNKAIFLAILSAIRELGPNKEPETTIGREIYAIFKESLSLNDSIVLSQYLKRAIEQLSKRALVPVFLFDRFSEFADKTTSDFFTNLKALRIASGGKLAIVFSTHRPLEELLPPSHWKDFYEFFVGNHVYMTMYDKATTDFRIEVLEKEYGKKLDTKLKRELVRLTNGHGKLMKLSTQILLNEPLSHKKTPNYQLPITNYLLGHILIKGSLLEIWQAFTKEERLILREAVYGDEARIDESRPLSGEKNLNVTANQNGFRNRLTPNVTLSKLGLPFPLLSEFIRRNIAEAFVPKTVRFDEKVNEIYFGGDPLEGLTAQEFRLLKFLIQTPNQVCDRDEIIEAVWSDTKTAAGVSEAALDQMVHRVRKKIEDEADNPKHLLTVKGRGFRFIP